MYSISSAGARLNGLIRGNTHAARAVKRNLYLGRQINTDVIMQGVSTPNPTESLVAVNRNGRYIKRAGPTDKGLSVKYSHKFYSTLQFKNHPSYKMSSTNYSKKFKIGVVGSGNWGTAVAKVVAENAAEKTSLFEPVVDVWVFGEEVNGKTLVQHINEDHENVKYLPDIKLPHNLNANPDLRSVVEGADIVVINIPHQYLVATMDKIKDLDFSKKAAISCLKGINVTPQGPEMLSDVVTKSYGLHCGVLSGANIATEVAKEKWCETTVAFPLPENYKKGDVDAYLMREVFERPYFHVQVSDDTAGVSIGGALKNVVAIGAGLVEGAGWGDNAKAAIMRHGIVEMVKFGKKFYPTFRPETICYESAGVADLITTCSSGRNVKVAREAVLRGQKIEDIEKEILNGQSAQGVITCKEVHELLTEQKMLDEFPLFKSIYQVICEDHSVSELVQKLLDARED